MHYANLTTIDAMLGTLFATHAVSRCIEDEPSQRDPMLSIRQTKNSGAHMKSAAAIGPT